MQKHSHIFLPEQICQNLNFTSPRSGGPGKYPQRDTTQHAQYLSHKFDAVWDSQRVLQQNRMAISLPTRDGTYIEFNGKGGFGLETNSLEDQRSGIKLLNVRHIHQNEQTVEAATVYIPRGKENVFINKLNDYKTKKTSKNKPSHDALFRSIEDLGIATLQSLWTGPLEFFPTQQYTWYEVWIRTDYSEDKGKEQCVHFIDNLNQIGIDTKPEFLLFYERAVVLIRANVSVMIDLLARFDCLAEFRTATTSAGFWCHEATRDQNEWIRDLLSRLVIEQEHEVLVCMLDSGLNNGHPLLSPLIPDNNCLTSLPAFGTNDPGSGHGTQMAGVIEYGDLEHKLESSSPVHVVNRLCSIKILPNVGENRPDMYGPITEQSVLRAEVEFPTDRKLYCMAVTGSNSDDGLPTSWSGTIDQLAYNDGNESRLLIISAGNISCESENYNIWNNYPNGNFLRPVQDPAQSWNALTIGAFTEKMAVGECPEYDRVAGLGELSPFSTTTVSWPKSSPIKPEIVFEGGNLFKTNDSDIPYTPGEEVESLTTNAQFSYRAPLASFGATSLATALASYETSLLMQRYPQIRPETVRALLVHSAEWTDGMLRQFPGDTKSELRVRLRCVGYGVPNELRLLNSLDNALTMIEETTIQPYIKKGSYVSMNEMHFIELPWPSELLTSLGERDVRIKVTLSYFVEPGPGKIGWTNKYRYQSCGLRFDLNDVNESADDFKIRINKKMRDENTQEYEPANSARWRLGTNNRDVGSLHCDYIEDSAINLANCKYLAVYPVGGWWKTRTNLKMYNKKIRYSLIVSLETPSEDVDIYSIVTAKVANMVPVPVEITV